MTSDSSLAPVHESRGAAVTQQRVSGGSRVAAYWTLYVLTLRQHLYGKRWLVMALLFLAPVGLAILVRTTASEVPGVVLEFMLAMMFIPQALLPIVALLYASGIVQDEQEEQTITYLLIRPIPKWALYTVKLLATVTTAVLLTVLFTALTYAAIYTGAHTGGENIALRCLKTASIHSLAVVSYCCLFGLISLLTRKILVIGVVYTVIVEGLLANLPFGIRLITVIYYARLITYRSLEFVIDRPDRPQGGREDMAASAWQFDLSRDPNLLEHPEVSTCLTVLLVGSLVCTVLAAWLCAQREFHVKTPEKD
ncbi:MAG: ABC transporter permease [Pirellulales bacterium]